VASNEVFAPDAHGRARLAHPFSTRALDRLIANGFDPGVLHEELWA
jgi:hypothetical protein